jgi:hypothetical protein
LERTSSSTKKVWATGAGSARPVVSIRMPSNRSRSAHQRFDDADQVPAHRAADAAIVHFEHLLVGIDDEIVIDADLAELVDDDREFLAMRLGEDAVEKRGLSCSEIAGKDGDGGRGKADRALAGTSLSHGRPAAMFRLHGYVITFHFINVIT